MVARVARIPVDAVDPVVAACSRIPTTTVFRLAFIIRIDTHGAR